MSAGSDLKKRKLHVNLSLQADLYGLAREHAKAEGSKQDARNAGHPGPDRLA
jgi:hypothetical protein